MVAFKIVSIFEASFSRLNMSFSGLKKMEFSKQKGPPICLKEVLTKQQILAYFYVQFFPFLCLSGLIKRDEKS